MSKVQTMPLEIWTDINGNATRTQFKGGVKYIRADERDRLARAIVWALGYTDFRARKHGEGPYWWRTELRLRAKLTGEQIDAILAALTPAGQRWTRRKEA